MRFIKGWNSYYFCSGWNCKILYIVHNKYDISFYSLINFFYACISSIISCPFSSFRYYCIYRAIKPLSTGWETGSMISPSWWFIRPFYCFELLLIILFFCSFTYRKHKLLLFLSYSWCCYNFSVSILLFWIILSLAC